MPEPYPIDEDYFLWHIKRRIRAVGMLWNRASDAWLAIRGLKTAQRNQAFFTLEEKGEIVRVELDGESFFIAREDQSLLEQVISGEEFESHATFIAPLDNLLWDRKLIKELFGFEYTWEVYKPAALRQYGYYVLPVLYGEKFVARFEPRFNKKAKTLEILNWWWEADIDVTPEMEKAIALALKDFMSYLSGKE